MPFQLMNSTWQYECKLNESNCLFLMQDAAKDNDPHLREEKVYWALVLVILPFLAVFGNCLIIISVYKEKNLQSATNYFIVSLAFADLLVAAAVMPFALYVLVNVHWELSETLCDVYIAIDVICSTASIFNLVAISIDRFIAVTQPIKYSKHKNSSRVAVTIFIVWFVSAAIGSPIVLGLNTSSERVPHLCVFYNSDFIIYSSLSSFYIPCIVMVFLYYKIFKVIHDRARKSVGSSARTNLSTRPNVQDEKNNGKINSIPKNSKVEFASQAMFEANDQTNTGSGSQDEYDTDKSPEGSEEKCDIYQESPKTLIIIDGKDTSTTRDSDNFNQSSAGALITVSSTIKKEEEQHSLRVPYEMQLKHSRFKLRRGQKSSNKKKEKASAKKERKATKTLAIVLGVFLACWMPFFTCNVIEAVCIKMNTEEYRPGVTVFLLTTWLGYMNSCVNPVIYTIFNSEFRKAFKKILMSPWIKRGR